MVSQHNDLSTNKSMIAAFYIGTHDLVNFLKFGKSNLRKITLTEKGKTNKKR